VGIAAGADGIGQQQAIEPAVDDTIAGLERHAATVGDEGGQFAVGQHIHRFGVGRRVAEGLHDHVRGELEAGQILQLVAVIGPWCPGPTVVILGSQ